MAAPGGVVPTQTPGPSGATPGPETGTEQPTRDSRATNRRDPETGRFAPRIQSESDVFAALRAIPPGGRTSAEAEAETTEAAETAPAEESEAIEGEAPETEAAEGETPETPEGEPEAPKTIGELAHALQVEEADLLELTVQGPDGAAVPLKSVLEGWRAAPEAQRLVGELTQQTQALEGFRGQLEAEHRAVVDRAVALIGTLNEDFEGAYASVNWQQLKDEDPNRYLMLRQERAEREQRLRDATDRLRADWQRAEGQRQQLRLARLDAEAKKLATSVPGWHEPAKATEEMNGLRAFLLKTYGLTDADLNVIEDHRFILAALDAMKYRAAAAKVPALREKLKSLPRPVLRSTARPEAPTDAAVAQRRKAAVLGRLRKSGSDADAAAAFKALGP